MADSPSSPDSYPYPDAEPDRRPTEGTPRWVKVLGIVALVLILLVGVLLLTGGGSHGPGRHTGSRDAGSQAPPSSVPESGGAGGHTPPAGGHAP